MSYENKFDDLKNLLELEWDEREHELPEVEEISHSEFTAFLKEKNGHIKNIKIKNYTFKTDYEKEINFPSPVTLVDLSPPSEPLSPVLPSTPNSTPIITSEVDAIKIPKFNISSPPKIIRQLSLPIPKLVRYDRCKCRAYKTIDEKSCENCVRPQSRLWKGVARRLFSEPNINYNQCGICKEYKIATDEYCKKCKKSPPLTLDAKIQLPQNKCGVCNNTVNFGVLMCDKCTNDTKKPVQKLNVTKVNNVICKYGDNCNIYPNCKFNHPTEPKSYAFRKSREKTRMCKFGTNCKRQRCFFAHSMQELRR
ncbi:hypothetical protein OAF54_03090 [bacterium]|nr:hypothetical protein [bacterium]